MEITVDTKDDPLPISAADWVGRTVVIIFNDRTRHDVAIYAVAPEWVKFTIDVAPSVTVEQAIVSLVKGKVYGQESR